MSAAATIPEALLATAERGAGEYVFHLDEETVSMSTGELAERAWRGARRLLALGVCPGDAVGVLGPNRPEWVAAAFAAWVAGAVLVPLQLPVRIRDRAAFEEQTHSVLRSVGCRRVLADPALVGLLPQGVGVPWKGGGDGGAEEPTLPQPADAAVIQFTSGSTSAPRGALITHAAASAQMGVLDGLVSGPSGPYVGAHWVPFFHDMGLFLTALTPAVWGARSHYLPTERFARDPVEWLRLMEASRAALALGPSTAFGSTLRALQRSGDRPDLSSLEMVRLVAEAVDPGIGATLLESAPQLRLRPEALGSGYGLAENVLAVTYTRLGGGLCFDRIGIDALAREGVALPESGGRTRAIASTGPRSTTELKIAGPDMSELPERRVGEILLRGPSLMSGYVGSGAFDPFCEGWLRTGDLGYVAEGELYVTGRTKDMVVVMGHNYYPEDFEWAAARADGVRPGRCVAFSLPDVEEVVVLVEASDGDGDRRLAREVRRTVSDAIGVPPGDVVVVPPGTVQKTTSGKLRRAAMRDAYASGALDSVTA